MAILNPEQERRRFERLASVREIVFGVQDGVLTTAGVLCGLSGAVSQRSQVVLAALASTAAGALSMGAGAYLGTWAESKVLKGALEQARRKVAGEPYVLHESLLEALSKEGLGREASYRVVKLLSAAPRALAATAEAKIYGLNISLGGNPIVDGLLMGLAFVLGALVPLVPFVLIVSERHGLIAAIATTAAALFAVGYFTGWVGEQARWRSGMHFLSVAMAAAAVGYLAGLAIARLGALSAVPAP